MKHGPLVFLAALLALSGSWGGFVLAPQIQFGRDVQTNALGSGDLYPVARPHLPAKTIFFTLLTPAWA